jgi:hypothetical protein
MSKYLVQKVARMPRTGYYNGTITLTNDTWFKQLPAHMRRQLLRNIYDTQADVNNPEWVIRVAGQGW